MIMIWNKFTFGFLVVLTFPGTTSTTTSTTTTAPPEPFDSVSIDRAIPSGVKLPGRLKLNESFSLGFRTCAGGRSSLLRQVSGDGDAFEIKLEGRNVLLTFGRAGNERTATLAAGLTWDDWFELSWNVSIDARIELKKNGSDSLLISLNSTLRDEIQRVDLAGGSDLSFGINFVGCLRSGAQIDLSSAISSPFVSTGTCFLDSQDCPKSSCSETPCRNNGTCLEGVPPRCSCTTGYNGTWCEEEARDDCSSVPCQNGGTCVEEGGSHVCLCVKEVVDLTRFSEANQAMVYTVGYEGNFCENWIDACKFTPSICIQGACRFEPARPLGFTCFCPQGADFRVGEYCQYKTDMCHVGSMCQNGGTCRPLGGEKFNCTCAPGFTGSRCEMDIDECSSNPCLFDGTCEDRVDGFVCSCVRGTTGVRCETNIDECYSSPCLNGGRCRDLVNGFVCNCTDTGYEGDLCQLDVDECLSSPCQNGGSCQDLLNNYSCSCYPGFTGLNCEIDVDECLSSPCANNATCLQNSRLNPANFSLYAGYSCGCVPGYSGLNCEFDIDECASSPCTNGNCSDEINSFSCRCHPGYKGMSCETKINACREYAPCQNNATCEEFFPDYSCICSDESAFGGKNCSIALIGCQNNSCSSGSVCTPILVDEVGNEQSHLCNCPRGFRGATCDVDTSFSFDESSSIFALVGNLSSVTFRFRTSLPRGLLMTFDARNIDSMFDVELHDGSCLRLTLYDLTPADALVRETSTSCSSLPLNSTDWNEVRVELNESSLILHLHHRGCKNGLCRTTIDGFNSANNVTAGRLHFGRVREEIDATSRSFDDSNGRSRSYVGCIDELKLDGEWATADTSGILFDRVSSGCKRAPQCEGRCLHGGSCMDLWNNFRCDCVRPHYGNTCSETMEAATFGHNLKPSFAIFNVSDVYSSSDLADRLEVSVFFRTRVNDGFLFFIEISDDNVSSDAARFVSCEIINGAVVVRDKLSENPPGIIQHNRFDKFLDGKQHFMRVLRNSSTLSLYVNDNLEGRLVSNETDAMPIDLRSVYVGGTGIVRSSSERKRSIGDATNAVRGFVGSLQDFSLNDVAYELLCDGNDSDSNVKKKVRPSECLNVIRGEVTSDICNLDSPCPENITCTNVFFNDYRCSCVRGFRGKNCQDQNYCLVHACPSHSVCNDVQDGFECMATGKFDGSASYVMDFEEVGLRDISWKVRTRAKKVRLIELRDSDPSFDECSVVVRLEGNNMSLAFNGKIVAENLLEDGWEGRWLSVDVAFENATLSLLSDSNAFEGVPERPDYDAECLGSLGRTVVTLAGGTGGFGGCFSEVRINGILLPFFEVALLPNVTSRHDMFLNVTTSNVTVGSCEGEDVCRPNPCWNGGTCRDEWNARSCLCVEGFWGEDCKGNASECKGDCRSGVLSQEQLIGIIAGTIGGAVLLVLLSLVVYGIVKVKTKRAKQGVYNPSMEEAAGASVQFSDALKIPPEERLI